MVAHRPGRSPGQRFRFEQYIDYLSENGFSCKISNLLDKSDDEVFYKENNYWSKLKLIIKSIRKRYVDVVNIGRYDLVFLYREAHMLGVTYFEKRIKNKGVKMILDFDDSIWLKDISKGNRKFAFLKRPGKTSRIIQLADSVIVGNEYLANYSRKFNPRVFVIPTTIDTSYYVPLSDRCIDRKPVCIGWTGSSTTLKHFALAIPVFKHLKRKFGESVNFLMISDEFYQEEVDGLEKLRWVREREVSDLQKIDIGIMPLPDDDWSKGKCGFKGLQYMALEIPTVMSPVGVNADIVQDGENGFLAAGHDEWVEKLSWLIESREMREKLGKAGRKTVVEHYSVEANKHKWLEAFQSVFHGKT